MAAYYGTGSGQLIADPSLRGITKSFGGGEAFNFDSGNLLKSGSSGMDPLSLGLGLGSSLIGGIFGMGQANTAASIAQAQMAMANQGIIEGRNTRDFQEAAQRRGALLGATTLGDISFEREKEAIGERLGRFAERQLGLGSEASKRERLARISPEAKEAARFENRLGIQRALAERRAVTDAMFGPVRGSFA